MSAAQESGIGRASPLGVIAGGGMLPRALVERYAQQGGRVAVVALRDFARVDDFSPYLRTELPLGRGRSMIRFFREHGVQDIVLIGAVRRPSWWEARPDLWTLWQMGRILLRGGHGDDGLLRAVRGVFEGQGFHLQAIQSYLPELIAGPGALGQVQPTADDQYDIVRGLRVAQALGAVDVGQSVVVQGGIVLGVEGVEGTDALIKRCATLKRAGPGPILVKAAKPQQDRALDLPTVGADTVEAAIAAGFRGIVVQAGATLVVSPLRMAERADAAGLFIVGVDVFSGSAGQARGLEA